MAAAGRRTLDEAKRDDLAEEALFWIGEAEQLEKLIGGLQEAKRIERLRLVAHLEECKLASREAVKSEDAAAEDLARFDEIDAQCCEIHDEMLELFKRGRVDISTAARAAGFGHTRPDLAVPGAIENMVARRRTLRLNAAATSRELEAI